LLAAPDLRADEGVFDTSLSRDSANAVLRREDRVLFLASGARGRGLWPRGLWGGMMAA